MIPGIWFLLMLIRKIISNYFNRIFAKVKQNGFILADNVLFHGQVLEKEIKGKNAKAIQAFNDYLLKRTDVEKMMLPLRDGLMLIRKLYFCCDFKHIE